MFKYVPSFARRETLFGRLCKADHSCLPFARKNYAGLILSKIISKFHISHDSLSSWHWIIFLLTSRYARRMRFYSKECWRGYTLAASSIFWTFWLGNVLRATRAYTFSTSQLPKVLRTRQFFSNFWLANVLRATMACTFSTSQLLIITFRLWKSASRHNGVHFFDVATSKSAPRLRCFVHFDFEMCLAMQSSSLIWPHVSAPAASASLLFDLLEPQIIGNT